MPTKVTVRGKTVTLPGVYSDIKSGIKNSPAGLAYGNIVIIDDGIGAGWGGGSGVIGEFSSETAPVYYFEDVQTMRDFVKGGPLWDIAQPLFKPNKGKSTGVSRVYLVHARETTAGVMNLVFNNTAKFQIKTKEEGLVVNSRLKTGSGELLKGYACKVVKGTVNTGKFMLQFYLGSYKGTDAMNKNIPYDGIVVEDSRPIKILESPEISTVQELYAWMLSSYKFNQYFKIINESELDTLFELGLEQAEGGLEGGAVDGGGSNIAPGGGSNPGQTTFNGTIRESDITGYVLTSGGSENYTHNASLFNKAVDLVKNLDNTFFLAMQYGQTARSANNQRLIEFGSNEAKYQKYTVIGGGYGQEFNTTNSNCSVQIANYLNSDCAIVVHDGCKITPRVGEGLLLKDQLYHTAEILGRICGLSPQTPITLKTIGIAGNIYPLNETQQEVALANGVLYSYKDDELESFVVGQGVNTLQNNEFLVNEDGTSFSVAVKRICSQLNKEILYYAKRRFYGSDEGPNRATITPEDITAWLSGFLRDRTASTHKDNLIIRVGTITVEVKEDNYWVTYEFVPNFEVSKMIFTGFMLEK